MVWLATLVYLVILVVQWAKSPPIVTSNALWSIGSGPFMMRMQCHARSGCLLSNKLSPESTQGMSDSINQTLIDGCVRVPHLGTLQMPLVYSINPFEGVSALYDPSTSDDKMLPRYGVTTASETMCMPYRGKGCVRVRESQAGPGVGSVMYVKIYNETETGDARHRQEFFAAVSTMNETVNPMTTECVPDPGWKEKAQARLTMASFYFDVHVRHDSFWMYLWGTAGGAYGSFFEVAALLLVLSSLIVKVYQKRLKNVPMMQASQSMRLQNFSPSFSIEKKSPNAVVPA
ncbi:hypothetical protein DUNSADRAFT_3349 [Dunaliella salina]|uniref:Uncharacterized protein n=1 Tax=Dunaliella salina TaxID=3046 RepID=A0ABQ7FVG6_DUNSA|nr:hypothetical protein DUNSADRAFT_3349 [Dunaliella salina]|eukprot:KAF5826385.1 hypothetical protein DUNSADRAFT_3349 [Dunaliella salina]